MDLADRQKTTTIVVNDAEAALRLLEYLSAYNDFAYNDVVASEKLSVPA
jgi:hypothetical protein